MPCSRKRSSYAIVIILLVIVTLSCGIIGFGERADDGRIWKDQIGTEMPGSLQYVIDKPKGIEIVKRKKLESQFAPADYLVLSYMDTLKWVSEENSRIWWSNLWPALGWGLIAAVIGYIVAAILMMIIWFLWWFIMHRLADIGNAWRGQV